MVVTSNCRIKHTQLKQSVFSSITSRRVEFRLTGHKLHFNHHYREKVFQMSGYSTPPATINQAVERIEQFTGLRRSPTQVRQFLKKLGVKRRKVGHVPAKADPEKQKTFLEEELEPRLEEAKRGKCHVFFVDAAHFVMQPFLGFLWCFARQFIRAPSGRKRFNVLGALHATTLQVVTFYTFAVFEF